MPIKKQERKERFSQIIQLMLMEKNKEAFTALATMCGEDTGLFFLCDYDKTVAKYKLKMEQGE
mgnify:CR=1 FL=1